MTTQPDHAAEAADCLPFRADLATAHALLAIHEQFATIAQRLPSRPVADELRAQVTNMHRPAPDCGKGFTECIQELLAHGYTASPDQEGGRA